MKKREVINREIPAKNYFIVLTVSIVVIIFTLYFRAFYLNYQVYEQNGSYFTYRKVNEITASDFDFILSEATDNILYVGSTSRKNYSLERKLYREIEKYNSVDKLLYWNVNDYLENDKYIDLLKSKFTNVEIYEEPSIIVIESGTSKGSYKVDNDLFGGKLKEILERNEE